MYRVCIIDRLSINVCFRCPLPAHLPVRSLLFIMSQMDGIPNSIWRDFPHPDGPNIGGREHIPFTDFEVILARQILSCSLDMQRSKQAILGATEASTWCNVNLERVGEDQRDGPRMRDRACNYEETVGTLGHKRLEMNDAFVDLADDDASTESSESGIIQVHNPCMRHPYRFLLCLLTQTQHFSRIVPQSKISLLHSVETR